MGKRQQKMGYRVIGDGCPLVIWALVDGEQENGPRGQRVEEKARISKKKKKNIKKKSHNE